MYLAEFEEDVVYCRVGVAGQQNGLTKSDQDTNQGHNSGRLSCRSIKQNTSSTGPWNLEVVAKIWSSVCPVLLNSCSYFIEDGPVKYRSRKRPVEENVGQG